MKSSGIYIHIPFCIAKCNYCDFYSVAGQDEKIDQFVSSLITEIEKTNLDVNKWTFDTIFIGGGTPSLLSAQQLEWIITAINKNFGLNNIVEFTMEVNPGEAPLRKLQDFRSMGVNRLSIGVQSFNSKLLQFLTRIHSAKDAIDTYNSARNAGFDNINCDLVYNIPDQTLADWENDLIELIELGPEHISAYSLTVEEGTALYDLVLNETIKMPDDEIQVDFYNSTVNILDSHKFQQYEISNYSKPGKSCLHNLHYWNHDKYIGFGPSAHSFDGKQRWKNFRNLEQYVLMIENDKSPIESYDKVNDNDSINEIIGFGLRMTNGVEFHDIPDSIVKALKYRVENAQEKFPDMIILNNNRLRLNQKGMRFADAIAVELMI